MRRLILILGVAAGLAVSGAARAQLSKPRRDPFVKVRPPVVDLAPPRKPAPLISLAPPPRLALSGLSAVGDTSPACRSQCSRSRYACDAAGDDACSVRWTQCLSTCAVPVRNGGR